ncbi:MAG: hypothetical protein R2697_17665 [Ilumatobacteraceae bacterium]
MSDDRLEVVQARAEGRNSSQASNRRARVERSRQRAEAAKAGVDQVEADEEATGAIEDELDDTTADDTVEESDAVEETTVEAVDTDDVEAEADEAPAVSGEFEAAEWAGSVKPDADGNGPDTHPIKGNADSMLYHTPDSRYYKVTKAEVWFDTEENAEAAGFSKPGSKKDED